MDRYHQRKELHLCVKCGKQDERTLAGKTRCNACVKKQKAFAKTRYQRLCDEHKCVLCGAQDARTRSGHTLCELCAKKRRSLDREQRAARTSYFVQRYHRRKEAQQCVLCRRQDARTITGKILCEACNRWRKEYDNARYQQQILRAKQEEEAKRAAEKKLSALERHAKKLPGCSYPDCEHCQRPDCALD